MKYFYIDNKKFNYILEFDTQNSKNNWKLTVPLIDYCETLGIIIPYYCYHKNLSIAGNCRMCLVELKKSPKPVVSCAMNAKSSLAANTEIYTKSPLVKKARENAMEFLLLNHPLDCPICDQGGECDLQDQSLFFGITKKRFYSFKRIVINKNLGSIVKTVMTRCIHCTKCVRFATEIAGIANLGVFGRGNISEIGTYVNKIFQSELSANIIDICPVGALTSKAYPFLGRNWELKKTNGTDPSDGFGINTQIFLKNNKVIKILSSYTLFDKTNSLWISDKTRFLFEGMFSSNRNVCKFFMNNSKKTIIFSWSGVFKKLVIILYFIDHLEKHLLKMNSFLILFNENSSIEVLNILVMLTKKYSFFQLKRSVNLTITNDLESDLKINTNLLSFSDLCLLFSINPRYESSYLNLKLKKRFIEGDFKILSLGSKNKLTIPTISIGSNHDKLKSIVEGNSNICKNIINSKNLMTIFNTEILYRKDSYIISNIFETFNVFYSGLYLSAFNLLNTSLNSVGISILNNFKIISNNEFNNVNGLYFINNDIKTSYLNNKLIEFELLNYRCLKNANKLLIEQNNKNTFFDIKNNLNILNYLYLPNTVFFENSFSYIDTEGKFKKTTKLISSLQNTKNDWQIIRKLISTLKKIEFTVNPKYNFRILYKSNCLFNFKNLMNFLYFNTQNLSKLSFCLKNYNQSIVKLKTIQKIKKLKIYHTQLKNWVDDFYLGGFDNYSNNSKIMSYCSGTLRTTTFTFLKS